MKPQSPHAPQALAARLEALAPGLETLALPACILDTARRYRFINAAYEAHAGRPRADFLGRAPDEIFALRPEDGRRSQMDRAFDGETVIFNRQTIEGPHRGLWVRAHYLPLREGAAVIAVLVVLVDIQEIKDAEAALVDRERQLSLITDAVTFPITYVDRDGIVRFANRASMALAGRSAEQMIGRPIGETVPADVRETLTPHFQRALAGERITYEREAVWPGGERRRIRGHLVPDRDGAGEVRGLLVVAVDIEDDHRLRRQLEDQRKQLQLVIDNIGVPMSYIDRDMRFRFANQPGIDWQVASPAEAIGKRIEDLYDPQTVREVLPQISAAMKGEKRVYERNARLADGTTRWVRVHLVPDQDAAGEVHGLYTLMIDVDEDHRMREALQRQEAQLRYFAENIPGPIAMVDAEFRYVFANFVFQHLRGLPAEQIVGRHVRDMMGPEAAALYFEPFVERLQRGETCSYERLVGPPGGQERWHLVRLAPIMAPEGRFNGYYIVGSDIHDLKLAEQQMRERDAQLRLYTDNIPDAVAYLDRDRRIVFANKHFAAQRQTTPERIVGNTTAQLMGPEVAAWIAERTQKVYDQGETASYEREMRLPDGSVRWLHVNAVPDIADSGQVRGMYVVAHDITEVKEVQSRLAAQEEELRFFAENIPEAIVFVDLKRGCTFVNNVFLATRGFTREQALGKFPDEVYPPEVMAELQPHLERAIRGEESTYERTLRTPAGVDRWVRVRITPRRDAAGTVMGFYVVSTDVHDLKTAAQELRRAHSILSAHFDNTPLAVIEWDTQLHVVRWSGQAEAIFGWPAAETLGRSLIGWRNVYEDDEPAASEMIRGLAEGRMPHATVLLRNYRKDGSVIWVEWHNSALRDESGAVISILSLAQDVSSRIQAEERLQFMATHDGLTALPNSVLLNDRLESALARARRSRNRVGVMFLDLDHFKDVNDSLGHRMGDLLLKELARRIRGSLRQSDLLARISGDEFVVVLEDVTDDYAPEHVARKILDEVRRPFHLEGNEVHVSCSLGVALHPEDGLDAETLLKNADAAMYHAKELGRNGFRPFSAELAQRRAQRLQLETALRRALREGELVLHYQPILDIASGRVERAEALLRWRDPERGIVLPPAFIPLAEETGLGHAVGSWVLETACRQARAWRDAGVGSIAICVNLSASQLRDTAMIGDLKRLLEQTGCEPGWLQFEITETSMVRDVEGASVVLTRLRALGVRIAIDDFGTGYSSLSHLRHLPVDVLKVDKAFVADIDSRARDSAREPAGGAAIVSAVIGLARGLGLDVVAEGVEKESQLEFLRREGCRAAQGYLICKPMPAVEFEAWLAARSPARPRTRKRRTTAKT